MPTPLSTPIHSAEGEEREGERGHHRYRGGGGGTEKGGIRPWLPGKNVCFLKAQKNELFLKHWGKGDGGEDC